MIRPVRWLLWLPCLIVLAWGLAALVLTPLAPALRGALALAMGLACVAAVRCPRPALRAAAIGGAAALLVLSLRALPAASNERHWQLPQARLPVVTRHGEQVDIDGVRNFRYAADGSVRTMRWESRSYDLSRIESAWLGVSPFGGIPGVGHVFVSFGFNDGRFLAVSVEARREIGEAYSPLRGMFRNYETIYVVADERDVVGLRTNTWQDEVYLMPVRASRSAIRATLLDMLDHINRLARRPQFYDTLFNSCSSSLARHVNNVAPGAVPWRLSLVLAGYSAELAYELGLLDFDGPFEAARARFLINDRARGDIDAGDFSARIRARPSDADTARSGGMT